MPHKSDEVTSISYKPRRRMTLKLTHHQRGYWCKQIDGKMEYFGERGGSEDDARRALIAFLHCRESQKVPGNAAQMQLHSLAAAYEQYYAGRVAAGHVKHRTWADYDTAIQDFVALVGARTVVTSISPAEFSRVAGEWRVLPPPRRANYIQTIKSMLSWAKAQIEYGPDFHRPDQAEFRAWRRRRVVREIPPDVLAVCWRYASPRLRCWLLLGLNCGMYAADLSALRWVDIRQIGGVWCLDWHRGKTGVTWIAPLWPETVSALPRRKRDDALVFQTKSGKALVRGRTDEVAQAFRKLISRAGLKRKGIAFGSVRHTHTTVTGGSAAAALVRGHAIGGMEELYSNVDRHISELQQVTDLARARLFVEPSGIAIDPAVVELMAAKKPGPKPRPSAAG
jgi:integrase